MDKEIVIGLAKRMANGDSRAFKDFFDLSYPRFYRLAYYYVGSDMLSEELVSDVFLKIWNNREKLPQIERLDYYFFQAVKNQAFTYLKKESKSEFAAESLIRSQRVEYAQPENLLIARELAAKIDLAISNLPEKCELIFRMVREDGMSYKEVANLLDVSTKTVENQMSIALKKLKVALSEEYDLVKTNQSFSNLWYLLAFLDLLTS